MTQQYVKVCRSKRAFSNELFIYESAYPYKADLIEIRKPNNLVLNKISGIPYLDVTDFSDEMISKLAKTISKFHILVQVEGKVLCHWDNQPRNILWNEKEKRFYLVDFEDIRIAYPEADVAHLFLFWAEVKNYESFIANVNLFINKYQKTIRLNPIHWRDELRKAKNRFDARRRKYLKLEKRQIQDRLLNRRFLHGQTYLIKDIK